LSFTIAVAGKGGTGKTTISSLVIRHFVRAGLTPVFAVDADANYNLNDQLGVQVAATIGGSREEMKRKINANEAPVGMSKDDWLEIQMQASLIESEGFDLLVMGRPEGPGCYCAANNMLRRHLEILAGNYKVVVIDNEAGMEHLSRRTTAKIDLLLLVSEPSPVGIMTAARIRDLAKELEIQVERTGLVINRVCGAASVGARLAEEARGLGLEVLGTVPLDDAVVEQALAHRPAFQLPDDAPAVKAIEAILATVVL
jgi:CO dehydrogenase maturation factor